jgi:type I restriction enzyme S subunit
VTKGLDPSVPMKDSGVEWLGEVPVHWAVAQFRRYVSIAEGQVNPEESPYSEMVLIAPNHVESATGRLIAQETAAEQGAESGKYLCKKGNVIYSKIRPALRKVCLAPVDCLCSADMYPLKSHSGLVSEYLLWYMLSEEFSTLAVLESERVAMPKINRETLNPVAVAVPPEGEQIEIAAYLSMATEGSDRLTTEATLAIDLLQERRSALISAAVTGQIDVRGLALKDAL